MSERDEEDIRPAKYPESDEKEHDAVDVFNYILDSSVKSYVDSRDKAPNHDGWLELVDDEGVPTGRIVVQVKKLPDKHVDDPKIQMETRHLSYCFVPIEPFVLIVVDTQNKIAFWREITPDWFEEEKLDENKHKTVSFPKENVIQTDEDGYLENWQEIIKLTRERIENYEEYEELKRYSNPAIGKKKPRFENIHDFLYQYNSLLKGDFNALKRGLYPNVWKFGFGSTSYKEDSVHYTLYPIEADENDAQIREIESSWDAVHRLGSNRRMGVSHDNPIKRSPKQYAYNVLEKQTDTLIEERKLDYTGCTFIATEYVFPFVTKFASLLGLERKESYSVSEIRDGYYRYLQFWLSEEMRDILQEHDEGEVHVYLDGYVEREPTPHEETAHEVAQEKTENIDSDPPRHQIHGDEFEQNTLEKMIKVLADSSVDRIEQPYTIRDRTDSNWDDTNHILDFYSDEAIFDNIQTYYTHYPREYRSLIGQNFPSLENQLSKYWTNFLVVVVDVENIRREIGEKKGWSIRRFWLESDEESLRTEFHHSRDEEVTNNSHPWKDDVFNYAGQEYDIVGGGASGDTLLIDLDHNQRPILENVHKELDSSVNDYIREKKVRIRHPERES